MAAEEEEGGIVLLGEKFETGGVGERVDGVFFREADGVRAFQSVNIGEEVIN